MNRNSCRRRRKKERGLDATRKDVKGCEGSEDGAREGREREKRGREKMRVKKRPGAEAVEEADGAHETSTVVSSASREWEEKSQARTRPGRARREKTGDRLSRTGKKVALCRRRTSRSASGVEQAQ